MILKFLDNLRIRLIFSLLIVIIWLGGNYQISQGAITNTLEYY